MIRGLSDKEYMRQYYLANKDRLKEKNKQWRINNLERARENDRQYRQNNSEKCAELSRQWKKSNPDKVSLSEFRRRLKKNYNMTVQDYDMLFSAQRGVCFICNSPPTGRRLVVDHCHNSGNVRGLLCSSCNRGLGLIGDDNIKRAAKYIRKYSNVR